MNDSFWSIFQENSSQEKFSQEKTSLEDLFPEIRSKISNEHQLRFSVQIYLILHNSETYSRFKSHINTSMNEYIDSSFINKIIQQGLKFHHIDSAKIPTILKKIPDQYLKTSLFIYLFQKISPFTRNEHFIPNLYGDYIKFKHKNGAFYTPSWIIDTIFQNLVKLYKNISKKSKNIIKIADISCGAGKFTQEIPHFFPDSAIFGVDIDPLAIELAYFNFRLFNGPSSSSTSSFTTQDSISSSVKGEPFDIVCGNPPWGTDITQYQKLIKKQYPMILRSSINFKDFSENHKGFSNIRRSYKIRDQLDIYSIFILQNINVLKYGGLLSLILPSNLLFSPVYEPLRRHLLKTTRILHIHYLGENIFDDVQVPCLILTLLKEVPLDNSIVHISILKNDKNMTVLKKNPLHWNSYLINQHKFTLHPFCNFTIFNKDSNANLVDHIHSISHYYFGDFVDNSRGVEIGKKGQIYQCPKCQRWNVLSHFKKSIKNKTKKYASCNICKAQIAQDEVSRIETIICSTSELSGRSKTKDTSWKPLIFGKDVQRYSLTSTHSIKLNYEGIKYKKFSQYNKPKILIRKTGKGIISSIDYEKRYTLQVVYQFTLKSSPDISSHENIPQDIQKKGHKWAHFEEYSLEYLFGIISSSLIEEYYHTLFANPLKKTFPHVIQANLLALPIPHIEFNDPNSFSVIQYKKIVRLVKEIFDIRDQNPTSLEKKAQLVEEKDAIVKKIFFTQNQK